METAGKKMHFLQHLMQTNNTKSSCFCLVQVAIASCSRKFVYASVYSVYRRQETVTSTTLENIISQRRQHLFIKELWRKFKRTRHVGNLWRWWGNKWRGEKSAPLEILMWLPAKMACETRTASACVKEEERRRISLCVHRIYVEFRFSFIRNSMIAC